MKQVLLIIGIVLILACIADKVEGMTCKDCHDIDKPANCRLSISCGDGEICLTEEYTDINKQRAYRLGCANAARCRLFLNAKTLFGKREISPKCYECCETDDCNANLCQSSGGHVTTLPPTHQVIQTNCSSGCPQQYVPFNNKCYFMSPSRVEWKTAQSFCQGHGGNLVSVNSKEEHDFLKGLANQVNASFIVAFWTGGFYENAVKGFEYKDGSPFNYTNWFPGYPSTSYDQDNSYYVVLANPIYSSTYQDLPMSVYSEKSQSGFACETNRN